MALFVVLLARGFPCSEANAQSNEWSWMKGPQTPQISVYGTLGTPAANNLPGVRTFAAGWTDSKGNLWLFGGTGSDSAGKFGGLNDLWLFNPSINEWAWMGGSNTINGSPVQGTLGTPAPGNVPGAHAGAAIWTDAKGNVWLFGGDGGNDLWEFNPSINEWAWMGGSSTVPTCPNYYCGQPGVYGKLGTAAVGNVPGTRSNADTWTDSHGNLWLFGGNGFDASGMLGYLNDLWEFNPSTLEWTWMGGNNTVPSCANADDCGQSGTYGAEGTPGSEIGRAHV
jgi:hypothetical protein